jgi:Ran GTPase-activating protein (RanGAP) involved in mRNA processing and transport
MLTHFHSCNSKNFGLFLKKKNKICLDRSIDRYTKTMSLWLSNTSLMRPVFPDWLEDVCQRLSENDPTFTTIEIFHQRLDDTSMKYFCKALAQSSHVTILIVSLYNVVDDGSYALGQVIASNKTIGKLQFRDLQHSREVITLFEAVRKNKTIEELSLRHCRICNRSAASLRNFIESHTSIREFRLVDSVLTEGTILPLAEGLTRNNCLERLSIINAEIGPKETGILGACISSNICLKELYLSENNIGNEGVFELCRELKHNTSLTVLDLRSNSIDSHGAIALKTLIESHNSLTHLYVGSNLLGCVGVSLLASGLIQNSRIRVLDLSDNGIEAAGACVLAQILSYNPRLEDLNLSLNCVGDQGVIALSAVLEENINLARLGLRRNQISNVGAGVLAKRLPLMRGLRELVLTKNSIDGEGAEMLLAGLRSNLELEYLHVMDSDLSQPILKELAHWMALNQAGRRIFRERELDPGIWAHVLAKVNKEPKILFHFLLEKPEFLQHSKKRKLPFQ